MTRQAKVFIEKSSILTGLCRGSIWNMRMREPRFGGPVSVDFDWAWVFEREERYGDILGFFHTHPSGLASPSQRDARTMRAWVSCMGKPLLCVIECDANLNAFVFETDEDDGFPFAEIQRFPRNVLIGVKENRHAR